MTRKSKVKPVVKWAQMSKLERAWTKLQQHGRGPSIYETRADRKYWSVEKKREVNRYCQLCNHWCKLKKESEAVLSS